MEVAALGLRIDGIGNIDQAATSLDRLVRAAERTADATEGMAENAGDANRELKKVDDTSKKTTSSLSSLGSSALKVGGVLAAAFSVTKVIQYADAWSDMQSRIGAVTGDMDGAGASMQRILQIANASYSPLSQTAEVYSRNVATFRDLGKSAAEAADFTEAVNNALVVTATRGEDAAVVVNSLSRSLAIGKLDADAFDTIVSRSPRTLKAVADEMGVTTIELRKLAQEGKVTSDVISRGLVGSLDQLKTEAAEMPATMTDAFVRVGNNVTAFVGIMDQATGASGALAAKIIELSDSALEMATSEEVIAGLLAWQGALAAIGDDFVELDRIISGFTDNAEEDAGDIGFSFSEIPANIRAAIQIATVEIASFIDAQLNGIEALAAAAKALPSGPSASVDAFNAVRSQMEGLGQARLESIEAILEERDAILNGAKDAAKAYKEKTQQTLNFNAAVAGGAPAIKAVDKEAEKAAKKQEDAAARLIEGLKQQLFQTEKRTAAEKLVYDIQKDSLKLSEEQLAQAKGLAAAIDAAAAAELRKSAEIDRQNTAYQLQESLIAKQQQYSGELSTAGMGPGAAGGMRERIAIEQQQQKDLRDMQHQHGQELRAAESDAERQHLQEMFNERLALSRTFMAQELAAYDEFTAQKTELDGNWLLGMQEGFASYSEQALDLYGQTAELVKGVMDTLTEGIAESMTQAILYGEDLRTSMAAIGQTIMESVLNSLIQMGVQYGINSALEIAGITAVTTAKNAAIATTAATSVAATSTTTATQVAAAATTTAAWTPAAIVSSIGSFGAAAAIGLAAVVAALAFSGGFKNGGYTGGGGVNDVAGVVHGREYVFDAAATSRIGVPTLEAIRAGRPIGGGGSSAAAPSSGAMHTQSQRGNVTVNQVNNFGSPDNRTANQVASATARKQRMAQSRLS